jgi:hypothetical protein
MPRSSTAQGAGSANPLDATLRALDPLVGAWATEASHPALPGVVVQGSADVEWLEGERFLILRTRAEHADFPDAVSIIGQMGRDRVEPAASDAAASGAGSAAAASDARLCMHYFDSRGVFRVYEAAIDGASWRLWRYAPGFSQRFTGTFADGGDTIIGLWQACEDPVAPDTASQEKVRWQDDLRITFRRRG